MSQNQLISSGSSGIVAALDDSRGSGRYRQESQFDLFSTKIHLWCGDELIGQVFSAGERVWVTPSWMVFEQAVETVESALDWLILQWEKRCKDRQELSEYLINKYSR